MSSNESNEKTSPTLMYTQFLANVQTSHPEQNRTKTYRLTLIHRGGTAANVSQQSWGSTTWPYVASQADHGNHKALGAQNRSQ